MARMIPINPKEFAPASREDEFFNALKQLPEEYYVFHSVSLLNVYTEYTDYNTVTREERQTDFVVFHPKKGLICIEAKNWRNIEFNNIGGREECYLNGEPKRSPFDQVNSYKYALLNLLRYPERYRGRRPTKEEIIVSDFICRFKIFDSVWLLSKTKDELERMTLPINVNHNYVLSYDDFQDSKQLEKHIELILDSNIEGIYNPIELNPQQESALINILAPKFTINNYDQRLNEFCFIQMEKQQYEILNFLEEQDSAVISGAAGTGKTMLAVEKAKRHAQCGEKVLYLCFNSELCNELQRKNQSDENIDFFTIDSYCSTLCGHGFDNNAKDIFYDECKKILDNSDPEEYPYQHVILDEGQDIKINKRIEDILAAIKTIIECNNENDNNRDRHNTFYIFYDKMQLMPYTDIDHNGELPAIITDADCKLTLYKNCRNTVNIAKSSSVTVTKKPPKMMDTSPDGDKPTIYYCTLNETEKYVKYLIKLTMDRGYLENDIAVLSLKGENNRIKLNLPRNITYTTVNKFKGLEAKVIIIVDFEYAFDTIENNDATLFYVASSRAREQLYIVSSMTDDEAAQINPEIFKWSIRQNGVIPRKIRNRETLERALGIQLKRIELQ